MQLECVERTIGVLDEKLLRSIESLEYNSTCRLEAGSAGKILFLARETV
jgi:hypothetical protein